MNANDTMILLGGENVDNIDNIINVNNKIVQLKSYDDKTGNEIGKIFPITRIDAVNIDDDTNLTDKLNEINTQIEKLITTLDDIKIGLNNHINNHPDATLSQDITLTGIDVGALSENDTLKQGTTFTEFIKLIGIKESKPIGKKPTISLFVSSSGVIEANTQQTIEITPTIIRNDGGDITNISLYRNEQLLHSGQDIITVVDTITPIHNKNIVYKAVVTYNDGPIPNTNLGNPYPLGQVLAGTLTCTGSTITPVNPSYYGIVDNIPNDEFELARLAKRISNNKNLTYNNINLNNEHIVYIYPATLGVITSIKDSNNFEYIHSYTKRSIMIDNVEYIVLYLTDKITIKNFKQIFS